MMEAAGCKVVNGKIVSTPGSNGTVTGTTTTKNDDDDVDAGRPTTPGKRKATPRKRGPKPKKENNDVEDGDSPAKKAKPTLKSTTKAEGWGKSKADQGMGFIEKDVKIENADIGEIEKGVKKAYVEDCEDGEDEG
jgi:hypothetical protein